MCVTSGAANMFSYMPYPDIQNFEDGFTYEVDDCKRPRATHSSCTTGKESHVTVKVGGPRLRPPTEFRVL